LKGLEVAIMKRGTVRSSVGAIVFLVVLSGVILLSTAFGSSFTKVGAYSQIDALAEGEAIPDADTPVDQPDTETSLDEENYMTDEDGIEVPDDGSDEDPEMGTGEEEEQGGEGTETDLNEPISEPDEPIVDPDDEQTDELTEDPDREDADGSDGSPEPVDIPGPRQYPPENDGDFYFAYFNVRTENNVKTQIKGLILRFIGFIDSIDPSLLTDVVLTRDGVPVDTGLYMTGHKMQYLWQYREITDFYFDFRDKIIEPGIYGLTGRYNGEWFKVYNKIIEEPVNDTPADASDLVNAGWCYYTGIDGKPISVSELVFRFDGKQNKFYQDDLTELVITRNGVEIPFSFMDHVFRYYEYNDWIGSGDTSFNLVLNEAFTEPGTYVAKGVYRGMPFTSMEITIP